MKIITPKTFCEIDPNYGPLFFLAGPVRGGDDWQKTCCEEIAKSIPNFYAAIPYYRKTLDEFPLADLAEKGIEDKFARQLDWERYYLEKAAREGCIIFWLPEESKTNPRPADGGAYATDTRGEIARWSVELKYNPQFRVVVGAEPGFPSVSQIERNFGFDQGCEVKFPTTLEETVKAAVEKVK